MTTGNFANWDGDLNLLGPIYPFFGWEGVMVIIALIFWIGWHILQIRAENRQLEEESANLRQAGNLQKAVEAESPVERF
jgi:hypothetical protein